MNAFQLDIEEDGLGILTFDRPGEKVNTFSREVFEEFSDVLVGLARETRLKGLLIRSGKPGTFIAGADVKEFVDLPAARIREGSARGQALFEQLARLPVPTIAAINGTCLGGGTELALACDYRLMSDAPKAKIGLPEVQLGIFPAWGGCTRLPRLVGLAAALDLILTGKQLDAKRARKIGLVDEAVPAAIFEDWSRRFAREKRGGGKPRPGRRGPAGVRDWVLEKNPLGRRLIFKTAREKIVGTMDFHYPAPLEALLVFEESSGLPIEAALEVENAHIANIFGGEVQRNLLSIFFWTEEVKKETGVLDSTVRPLPVTRVGVLGAGVMGGGIAQLAADKGIPARMKDIEPDALAHGYAAAAGVWKKAVERRRLKPRQMAAKMALLSGTLDYSGFSRCEVTIEAVVEKLGVKRAVLKEWEAAVPETAIFASNTSTIPIGEIAAGALAPERVVGMHFFNPVDRMPLVEVIRGPRSSDSSVATVFALAKTLGKTPVVVKDSPGFLVNRILAPYLSEGVRLVKEGCPIENVDRAMTEFGMPVGPLALLDDVGLDVAAKAAEVLEKAFPDRMRRAGDEALAAAGRLGRKSGRGFYDYRGGKRAAASSQAYGILGVTPGKTSPVGQDEIESRLVFSMINEAAYCMAEELVASASKLDLAMIFGTGFPPFRGGLLRHADSLGSSRVLAALEDLASRLGTRFQPAPLLRDMARSGAPFHAERPTS